mmetsp:Transcript_41187/g.111340  ORF Transcript_41187/g.111340 Transcript_41187/m.111340 type:complete len:228 (+) Transcript_41187:85-768(+)
MLLPRQDPLLAGSFVVGHPDGVLGHHATAAVDIEGDGHLRDAWHVATTDSQVLLRNLADHAILDPSLLGNAPHLHNITWCETSCRGTLELCLLQHELQQGMRLVQQGGDTLPVLPLLPALHVLRLWSRWALQELCQACVVRPLPIFARATLAHELIQLLWHVLKLLPLRTADGPTLLEQLHLRAAHALRHFCLQLPDVTADRAEGVLQSVELLQGMEPRQLAKDAVH